MGISGIARRLADVPRQGVVLALEGPQQLAEVWDDVAGLVRRASRVLDRVDLIVARLERKIDEVEELILKTDALTVKANGVVTSTEGVTEAIAETRAVADDEVGRLRRLLDLYQPTLQALAPLVREAGATMKPSQVRGLAKLLDEIPDLVDSIAPALQSMANLSPHMEDVTDRMTNVGQVVEGLPGAKRLKRRGQEREEASD